MRTDKLPTSLLRYADGVRRRLALRSRVLRAGRALRVHAMSAGPRLKGLYHRAMARGQNELMQRRWARQVQSYIDINAGRLATAALRADFPYRIAEPVRGRALFGISSLTSGGAERQMFYTIAGATQRGREAHLLVEYLTDKPSSAFFLPQVKLHARSVRELTNDDLRAEPWLARHPEFARALTPFVANRILNAARQIAEISPEVVQTSLDWTNVTFGLGAWLAGVPRIIISGRNISPMNFDFFHWFMLPGYRALLSRPNVVMTNNSQAGANDYAAWLGVRSPTIKVVHNGVDLGLFPPITPEERNAARAARNIANDAPVIAGAFRMSAEKRPLMWVETMAAIRRVLPKAEFHLYGIGPMAGQVEARAKALGLDGGFYYHGLAEKLRDAVVYADLVLMASEMEGTPNVLIEAQAMGLPVITTPARGAEEAVEDGVTGRVVRTETAEALAQAAIALLSDQPAMERARMRGPEWIAQRFGMQRMIDETLALHQG